jgi:predicted nucleic acid-binding protein
MPPAGSEPVPAYVLDSYAVLAYLEGEPGADRVAELLRAAAGRRCHLSLCAVNLGEVMYIVERERGLPRAQETLARIYELPVEVVDPDRTLTLAAAHLKAQWPVAYADCFAAALARARDAPLLTGDPEFGKIGPASAPTVEWLPGRAR